MKYLAMLLGVILVSRLSLAAPSRAIIQFTSSFASTKLAVLPSDPSMIVGQLYRTSRESLAAVGARVPTGLLKIVEIRGGLAFGLIVEAGTGLSKTLFQKFEGPMAGDTIEVYNPTISKTLSILPDVEMTYVDLFKDPRASPGTFEITDDGLSKLTEKLRDFRESKAQMVLVEGYTDLTGSSDANQAESYQRALAVRAMILRSLDLRPDKVVAVGYGDGEQKAIKIASESKKMNRRIVIRAINLPE